MSEKQGIFLLGLKKSKKREGVTYCIGETDNDREYRQGEEVSYIYNANYTNSLQSALNWLDCQK